MDEAKLMNQFLYAVDCKDRRSYAYTCYEKEVGGVSYVDTLRSSGLFTGARGGSSTDPLSADNLNLFDIPSMSITDEVSFEEVIDYVEAAIENRTLAVFCFHGIGGDYIVTSREFHQKIIDYLKEKEELLWITTMVNLTDHLSLFPVEVAPDNSSFGIPDEQNNFVTLF